MCPAYPSTLHVRLYYDDCPLLHSRRNNSNKYRFIIGIEYRDTVICTYTPLNRTTIHFFTCAIFVTPCPILQLHLEFNHYPLLHSHRDNWNKYRFVILRVLFSTERPYISSRVRYLLLLVQYCNSIRSSATLLYINYIRSFRKSVER